MRRALGLATLAVLSLVSSATGAITSPHRDDSLATMLRFASAVAVADGDLLIGRAGASARSSAHAGGVHVFRVGTAGTWREVAVFAPKDLRPNDIFGASLAVDGTWLAVGAPGAAGGRGAIYLFQRDSKGRWIERTKLTAQAGDSLGETVALKGSILLAGMPGSHGDRGMVTVFRRSAAMTWSEQVTLTAPDTLRPYRFGQGLAIVGDRVLIGAPGMISIDTVSGEPGRVSIFRDSSGVWVEEPSLTITDHPTDRGFGAALLVDRANLWISSPGGTGAVHHFRQDAPGRWTKVARLRPSTPADMFGYALARDGQDLAIGAPDVVHKVIAPPDTYPRLGAVYVMRYDSVGKTWSEVQRLTAPGASGNTRVGEHLAAGRGIIAVGVELMEAAEGMAVVFRREAAGGKWRDGRVLVDSAWNTARKTLTGTPVRCQAGRLKVFDCQNVEVLSFLPGSAIGGGQLGDRRDMWGWGDQVTSVWGWTDSTTNREFAVVARITGTSFVDVTDPLHPRYLGNLPFHASGHMSIWRDVKVYQNHAFIVSEGGKHGMQVFDLTQLRNVQGAPVTFTETAHYDGIEAAHTIAINAASGFAYPVGANGGGETCGGGLHMIDIRTPTKPAFAGCYNEPKTSRTTGYIHETACVTYQGPDAQYRGREICLNASVDALGIADVTDKKQPKTLSIATYPNAAFAHQAWFSDDQRYVFLNDEQDEGAMAARVGQANARTRTIVFDMKKLDDPVVLTEFYGNTSATDHNLYIRGRYMYQSNYDAGLRIIDIADPQHLKEVGYLDTTPPMGQFRIGSWSNYPYFKNDVVAVTSGSEGLFLVRLLPTSR